MTNDYQYKYVKNEDVQVRSMADQLMLNAHIYAGYDPVAGAEMAAKAQAFASGDIDLKAKQYEQSVLQAARSGDPNQVINAINQNNPGLGNYDIQKDGKGGFTLSHYVNTATGHVETGQPVQIKPDTDPKGNVVQTAYEKLVSQALSYATPQAFKDHAEASFTHAKDQFAMLLQMEQAKVAGANANYLGAEADKTRALLPNEVAEGQLINRQHVEDLKTNYGVNVDATAPSTGVTPGSMTGTVNRPGAPSAANAAAAAAANPNGYKSHDVAAYLQDQGLDFNLTGTGRTLARNAQVNGTADSAHLFTSGDRAVDLTPKNGQSLGQLQQQVQGALPGARVIVEGVGAAHSDGVPHVHAEWPVGYTPPKAAPMGNGSNPGQPAAALPGVANVSSSGADMYDHVSPQEFKATNAQITDRLSSLRAKLAGEVATGAALMPKGMNPNDWIKQQLDTQEAYELSHQSPAFVRQYSRVNNIPFTPPGGAPNPGPAAPSSGASAPPPAAQAKPSPSAIPMPQSSDQQFVSSVGNAINSAVQAGQQKHEAAMNQVWVAHYQQPYEMFHQQYVAARQTGKAPDTSVIRALAPALSDTSFRNKIPPEELKYLQQAAR